MASHVSHLPFAALVGRMTRIRCRLSALEILDRLGTWPSEDPEIRRAHRLASDILRWSATT